MSLRCLQFHSIKKSRHRYHFDNFIKTRCDFARAIGSKSVPATCKKASLDPINIILPQRRKQISIFEKNLYQPFYHEKDYKPVGKTRKRGL